MAIEKDYLTTYGWTAPNAYFKINSINLTDIENECVMEFFVYLNEQKRSDDPEKPLVKTRLKFEIDKNEFDNSKSLDENLKTQGYIFLKNSTNSFRNKSLDV